MSSFSNYFLFIKLSFAAAISGTAGCLGSAPQQFHGDVKISPDGTVLAVIEYERRGARLKIKTLNTTASVWKTVSIPTSTGSFNFSPFDQKILITYKNGASGILARIDLDDGHKFTELYRSELGLAFPNEISPGRYLVQAVARVSPNGYPIHQWKVITLPQDVVNIGEEFGPPYSNVSIQKNGGFFIVTDAAGVDKIRLFSLPNGVAPDIKKYVLQETVNLTCDRSVETCVQLNRYLDGNGYFFKLTRISDSEKCEIQGLPRWIRSISITPDGKHVLILASINSQTKPFIELLSFTSSGCKNFIKITQEF